MQDITDNPAFPIIEYLQEQIKQEEQNIVFWAASKLSTAEKLHNNAVHRMYAFKEVLDFIEETFKPE